MSTKPTIEEVRDAEARARECEERLASLAEEFGDEHLARAIGRIFNLPQIGHAEEAWRKTYNPEGHDVDPDPAHAPTPGLDAPGGDDTKG